MSAMTASELYARFFSVGLDILSTTVDPTTGVITVQLGDSTKSVPDTDTAELWGPIGLAATPLAPTSGNSSCQSIAVRHSDHDMVIATRDVRNAAINADLDPAGESALYAPAGSATNGRVVCRKDGTIQAISTQQISLGSKSPADAAALASKIDAVFSALKQVANDLSAVAVNPTTGDLSGATWPTVVTALEALINAIPSTTASQIVKVAS